MTKIFRFSMCVFLMVFSYAVNASERVLMEVDFSRPVWKELLRPNVDKQVRVVNGKLILKPHTFVSTQIFPYRAGTSIIVSFKIKTKNVVADKAGWQVARPQIVGYDGARKGCCHHDLTVLKGTCSWKTIKREITLTSRVRYFSVQLTNEGRGGTVWYDDLKIILKDDSTEDLIGDSSFEGTLGVDHWFTRDGVDWDGFRTLFSSKNATVDYKYAVAGKRCVRMFKPHTLVSHMFPYNGQALFLSGWIRVKDVKHGKAGWASAGIQLVGFDKNGKHISHYDLKLLEGTRGWQWFVYNNGQPIYFPPSVKKIQVWLRLFEGAFGTVWFDQVRLEQSKEGMEIVPFNAKQAKIEVDASIFDKNKLNPEVWSGVATTYICELFTSAARAAFPLLKKAGFERIRVGEISNGLRIYVKDDANGNPIYDWKKFDYIFDILVKKYGFKMSISLDTTPPALARPGTNPNSWCNRYPPKDFKKWGKYIEAIFSHAIERYGKDAVEKWLWELWNEPGPQGTYYKGNVDDFIKIAEEDYLAAERVEKKYNIDLKMGLTSGGVELMNEVVLERLRELGKLYLVDYYSRHVYLGIRSPIRLLGKYIDEMDRYQKQYPQMHKYLIGISEWSGNSMAGEQGNTAWQASHVIKFVKIMLDHNVDYSMFYTIIDNRHKKDLFWLYGMGIFTRSDIPVPKAVYNSFVFLNQLRGGRRIKLVSSNDPVDGIAAIMPDGTVRIILTNYDEDLTRQPYTTKVTVKVKGIAAKRNYKVTRYWIVDDKHGNPYRNWLQMGKPELNDKEACEKLAKLSKYAEINPPKLTRTKDNILRFIIDIPSPGVQFIELK